MSILCVAKMKSEETIPVVFFFNVFATQLRIQNFSFFSHNGKEKILPEEDISQLLDKSEDDCKEIAAEILKGDGNIDNTSEISIYEASDDEILDEFS